MKTNIVKLALIGGLSIAGAATSFAQRIMRRRAPIKGGRQGRKPGRLQ